MSVKVGIFFFYYSFSDVLEIDSEESEGDVLSHVNQTHPTSFMSDYSALP